MKRKYLLNPNLLSIFLPVLVSVSIINSAFALPKTDLAKSSAKQINADLTISGKVTDVTGASLPGVTVSIKGTTTATATDVNGAYRISVPNGNAVLVYSFVGFTTKEVAVSGNTTINVSLQGDTKTLTELVVVGYGTQKRASVTGAVSSVSGKTITALPVRTVEEGLQGRVAGLTVVNNGSPGNAPIVRIRGISSIGYNSDPLYIIDGFPGPIGGIDPKDIQSVDVLKDASAAAIYGSRATNGVIIITTRKGATNNKVEVGIDSYVGFQKQTQRYDLLNTDQYVKYATALDGAGSLPPRLQPANFNLPIYAGSTQTFAQTNTDWQDAFFKTGVIQQHNLTLSGGTEKTRFYTSAGYFDQQGTTQGTYYTRKNFRTNADHNINKFISIGETFNVSSTRQRYTNEGNRTSITNVVRMLPYLPVYNPNNAGGFMGPINSFDGSDPVNPIENSLINENHNYGFNIHGNAYLTAKFTPWLTFKSNYGIDYGTNRNEQYTPIYDDGGTSRTTVASINEGQSTGTSTLYTQQLTFDKTFAEKHHVSAVAVYEVQTNHNDNQTSFGNQNNNLIRTIHNATNTNTDYTYQTNVLQSLVGRVGYDFEGKYLISGSLRRDALSVWAPGHKYENFPAASVGWVVSQEDFLKNSKSISELKIRAGYGVTGINGTVLGNYPYLANVQAGGTTYPFGGVVDGTNQGNGSYYNSLSNYSLHWEITKSTNIGVDLGLFQNAITVSAEVYKRKTENLLLGQPVPPSSGINPPLFNVGSMQNTGVEFTLGYHKTTGDFKYDVTGVFGLVRNKVLDLSTGGSISQGGDADFGGGGPITNTVVGKPIQDFYGYQVIGIFQNADDVSSHAHQTGAAPGDLKFKDVDGNGQITDADRVDLGSYIPKFNYSLNYNASYKNFDLSLFFQGVYGNKIFNAEKIILEGMPRLFNADVNVLRAWTPSNTNTDIPRAANTDPAGNVRVSSRWIESGSYFRLKNLQFGYNVPTNWLKTSTNNYISKIRIYLSATNLFTITKYTGLDPEIGTSRNLLTNGVDYGQYPTPKVFQVGLQATF